MRLILFVLLFCFVGCKDSGDPTNPADSPSEAELVVPRWKSIKGITVYTDYAKELLETEGQYLLTGPIHDWEVYCSKDCSSLNRKERKSFWIYFLSLMVEKESYFREKLEYRESFRDRFGNYVISTGLFQISLESSTLVYKCDFIKEQSDLYDPYKNMKCSIRILNKLISQDQRIQGKKSGRWAGGARYWSVLRSSRPGAYDFIVSKSKENF